MMIHESNAVINLSVRLYRLLLWLYPAAHRCEYGPLMTQVFRDQCRTAYRDTGAIGVVGMWLPLMGDLAITLVEEHRQKVLQMNTSIFARFCGHFFMLGGALLAFAGVSQLQPGSHYEFRGIYMVSFIAMIPGFVLVGCGLVGVYQRYQSRLNAFGRFALILVTAGAFGSGLGWFALPILGESGWAVLMISLPVYLVSGIAFGIAALVAKPLPRWNFLPIIAGAVPLAFFLFVRPGGEARGVLWGDFAIIVTMGLCWFALGYGIFSDKLPETQSAPAYRLRSTYAHCSQCSGTVHVFYT
jgi:hypothetical protein